MWSWLVLLTLASCFCYQQWHSIYHKVTHEPEYSEFHSVIKEHHKAILNLYYTSVTVFVPENNALQDYERNISESLVLYHMGNGAHTLVQLRSNKTLHTIGVDNPPLWITVSDEAYYVNNVKIIEGRSNYAAKSQANETQVLHMIDGVLDHQMQVLHPHPTANDFLSYHWKWNIGSNRLSHFVHKIKFHRLEKWYKQDGGHTYFIPVDQTDYGKLENIDSYVVQGHVVPDVVLFTRSAAKNHYYDTAANDDYVRIVVSFVTIGHRIYVRSNTVSSDSNHKKGEILSEIVKGDIPLTNGVAHLISRPLAVFERELRPFPYLPVRYKVTADPTLNLTFTFGRTKVNKLLERPGTYTYFAPRDRAWANISQGFLDILDRHVVLDQRYDMAQLAAMSPVTLKTLGGTMQLTVARVNGSYFVQWKEKVVRVYRPDYQCTDGVVHVMDGVFAMGPSDAHRDGFWGTLKALVM